MILYVKYVVILYVNIYVQSFNIVVYYYHFHKKSRKCPKFTSSRPPSPLKIAWSSLHIFGFSIGLMFG